MLPKYVISIAAALVLKYHQWTIFQTKLFSRKIGEEQCTNLIEYSDIIVQNTRYSF